MLIEALVAEFPVEGFDIRIFHRACLDELNKVLHRYDAARNRVHFLQIPARYQRQLHQEVLAFELTDPIP